MVRIGAIALGAGCFELFHLNIKVDDDNGQKSYSMAFFLHPLLFPNWSLRSSGMMSTCLSAENILHRLHIHTLVTGNVQSCLCRREIMSSRTQSSYL